MITTWLHPCFVGAALGLLACRASNAPAITLHCPPATTATVTRDSSAGLCLPAEFQRHRPDVDIGRDAWTRGAPGAGSYAYLSLHVLDSAEAAHEWGVPPRPRPLRESDGPDAVDGVTTDSVVSHRTNIGGRAVDVETGLITGGFNGMHRQPHVRAVWPVGDGRWVIIQGQSKSPQTVDSLRAVISSVQVAMVSHHEAAP
jgi:hypothetical protein